MRIRPILLVTALAAGLTTTGVVSYCADAAGPASKAKSKKGINKPLGVRPAARVYIDPVTGEMGAPPPGEGPRAAQADASNQRTAVTVNQDGSLTAVVPRERMVYAIATIKADGEVAISEATAEDAKKLLRPVRKGKK